MADMVSTFVEQVQGLYPLLSWKSILSFAVNSFCFWFL